MASMDGRIALVTGATGGIGNAVATALARQGSTVAVVGRSEARAEEAMRERQVTPDGLELTFATNVMSYFLVTNLLIDALKRAALGGFTPRIVNVNDLQTA